MLWLDAWGAFPMAVKQLKMFVEMTCFSRFFSSFPLASRLDILKSKNDGKNTFEWRFSGVNVRLHTDTFLVNSAVTQSKHFIHFVHKTDIARILDGFIEKIGSQTRLFTSNKLFFDFLSKNTVFAHVPTLFK